MSCFRHRLIDSNTESLQIGMDNGVIIHFLAANNKAWRQNAKTEIETFPTKEILPANVPLCAAFSFCSFGSQLHKAEHETRSKARFFLSVADTQGKFGMHVGENTLMVICDVAFPQKLYYEDP